MPSKRAVDSHGEINAKGLDFTWTIKNFKTLFLKAQKSDAWDSPNCNFDSNKCCYLQLVPKGEDESCKEYMSIFAFATGCTFDARVTFYVLNSMNYEVNHRTSSKSTYGESGYGWASFLRHDRILFEPSTLLKDGNLTIGCRIYIDSVLSCRGNKIMLKDSECITEFNRFEKLLLKQQFSDVKFQVDGQEILAHKNIIASGSPVFAAMFSQPTTENDENLVVIPDITFSVMQELLRFIYAARVMDMENLAEDLLKAADKYMITGLKQLCEDYLSEKLSVKNVMEYLALSNKYNATFLKACCMEYISSHAEMIIDSPFFKECDVEAGVMKEMFSTVVRNRII